MVKTERELELSWALQSENAARIRAMLDIARHLPGIYDDGRGWNEIKHKLAAGNCVINLRTGEGERGNPDDKISLGTDVDYNPDATAPRWERFLEEIFPDEELRAYIKLAAGYSITGETSEQCFFLCYGSGANGKSTFLSAISHALGELSYTLPFAVLEPSRYSSGEGASPYLADLEGRRFVVASEVNENTRLDEARIKELTGESEITARRLHKNPFTYKPQLKLWLAVNHKPRVADDSDAFWRRPRFIPFLQVFKGDAIDTNLNRVLYDEAPGVLRWLVEGARDWYEAHDDAEGAPVLSGVPGGERFASEWRGESDPIQEFIDTYCVQNPNCRVERSSIFEAYLEWADSVNLPKSERISRTSFIRRLTTRYETIKSGNARYFRGLGLLTSPEQSRLGDGQPGHTGTF